MKNIRKLKMIIASILAVAGMSQYIVMPVLAAALTSTPTGIAAGDKSTLRSQLTATATTATLESFKKYVNGQKISSGFDTSAGFIMIQDSTGRTEWASYGSKSVNSGTLVTTLSDMRRGLDPRNPSFQSGTGIIFDAGSVVQVVDWPVLYNYSLYLDKTNTLTGSGQITSNQTKQAALDMNCVTTAQRDSFSTVSEGNIICNSTTGNANVYIGGAWLEIATATGSFVNATTSVAGKVEIATDSEVLLRVATGSTASTLVIPASSTAVLTKNNILTNSGTQLQLNASGDITVTYPYHSIVANSGTADDLERISTVGGQGTSTGQILFLRLGSGAQVINVKNGSGNILIGQNVTLSSTGTTLQLRYDGVYWRLVGDTGKPVGEMGMWMTNTAPVGHLLAYGQAVSRTTYSNLFSVYGTTFGVGDGSTTFNLPDLRGRFPLGQDDMGGSSANNVTDTRADTIGSGSGSETVTLTDAQVPSQQVRVNSDPGGSGNTSQKITDGTNSVTVTTANTGAGSLYTTEGGGGAHNNMPPYITINYIIKY